MAGPKIFSKFVDLVSEYEVVGANEDGTRKKIEETNFEKTVSDFVADHESVAVGHLYSLNLADLIVKKDIDLARIAKTAQRVVQEVIEENLGPDERYSHSGDFSYLLFFPKLTDEAGRLKCAVISDQIARRLNAVDLHLKGVEYKSSVQRFDGDSRMNSARNFLRAEDVNRHRQMKDWATRAMEAMIPRQHSSKLELNESHMQILYRPVWYVKKKLLTGYRCNVVKDMLGIEPGGEGRALPESLDLAANAQLDLLLCRRATATLAELVDNDRVAVFIIPVRFDTVDRRPYRDEFFRIFQELDPSIRRFAVLELVDISEDLPRFRLQDVLGRLRSLTRAIIAEAPLDFAGFNRWKDVGLHAVSVDLTGRQDSEARLMRLMEKFAEQANRNNLRTYIHGLRSISLTTAAVCAGFDYLDGDTVTRFEDRPAGIRPFESQMIYSPLLEAAAEPARDPAA